jgi:hypothetical protein
MCDSPLSGAITMTRRLDLLESESSLRHLLFARVRAKDYRAASLIR